MLRKSMNERPKEPKRSKEGIWLYVLLSALTVGIPFLMVLFLWLYLRFHID
jgi:hypothetical protein